MIPRPLTEDAARHNPGRWICNKRPEKCDGTFQVYNQAMKCPLRAKCFWGRRNTYEWSPGEKLQGRFYALDTDAKWRREHGTRLAALHRLWGPKPTWRPSDAQRERYNAHKQERRRQNRPADCQSFGEVPPRPLLPCGEDCDCGCPYDGPCPYSDADVDALVAQAVKDRARTADKAKKAREKAREAIDPDYKAHRRELDKVRQKRYYEAHKDVLRAKARERNKKYRERMNHNGNYH